MQAPSHQDRFWAFGVFVSAELGRQPGIKQVLADCLVLGGPFILMLGLRKPLSLRKTQSELSLKPSGALFKVHESLWGLRSGETTVRKALVSGMLAI